jgi:1-acyl-sn-glycerol-3-phosphate acyltransferase
MEIKTFAFWKLQALKLLITPAMFILGPTRCRGRANIPKTGGLLIVSNHRSDMDPPTIQYRCFRHINFMAKSELFEMKYLGKFLRWFGAFPVQRGEGDRQSLKHAIELLRAGHAVGIFPEGELSETGETLPLKPGIALIARQAGVPVICVWLENTARMMPYRATIPRPAFRSVWVNWGTPRLVGKETDAEEFLAWVNSEFERLTPRRPCPEQSPEHGHQESEQPDEHRLP